MRSAGSDGEVAVTDLDPAKERDWGNIRFRGRRDRYAEGTPEDNANARFVIGVLVFLTVAVAYPWYSYWVSSRLLARDIEAGLREFEKQAAVEVARVNEHLQQRQAGHDATARAGAWRAYACWE